MTAVAMLVERAKAMPLQKPDVIGGREYLNRRARIGGGFGMTIFSICECEKFEG